MRIAGGEFAEGVADANDRTPVKLVIRDAPILDPGAVDEAIPIIASEPCGAASGLRLRIFFSHWNGQSKGPFVAIHNW